MRVSGGHAGHGSESGAKPTRSIRAASLLVSLIFALAGCASRAAPPHPSGLQFRGVTVLASMTAELLAERLPGTQCASPNDGPISYCTMNDAATGWPMLTALLFEGKVAGFIGQVPVEQFPDLIARFEHHLGRPGEVAQGLAGPHQADLDQVSYTWIGQDGSYVRVLKREFTDPRLSIFVVLTGPLHAAFDAAEGNKEPAGDSRGRCEAFSLLCGAG